MEELNEKFASIESISLAACVITLNNTCELVCLPAHGFYFFLQSRLFKLRDQIDEHNTLQPLALI